MMRYRYFGTDHTIISTTAGIQQSQRLNCGLSILTNTVMTDTNAAYLCGLALEYNLSARYKHDEKWIETLLANLNQTHVIVIQQINQWKTPILETLWHSHKNVCVIAADETDAVPQWNGTSLRLVDKPLEIPIHYEHLINQLNQPGKALPLKRQYELKNLKPPIRRVLIQLMMHPNQWMDVEQLETALNLKTDMLRKLPPTILVNMGIVLQSGHSGRRRQYKENVKPWLETHHPAASPASILKALVKEVHIP